jgi:hypothetical protein
LQPGEPVRRFPRLLRNTDEILSLLNMPTGIVNILACFRCETLPARNAIAADGRSGFCPLSFSQKKADK